jgi:hypothetical protein
VVRFIRFFLILDSFAMKLKEFWKSVNWLQIFMVFFSLWSFIFIILINAAGTRIYQSTSPHKYNSTLLGNFQLLTVSSSDRDLRILKLISIPGSFTISIFGLCFLRSRRTYSTRLDLSFLPQCCMLNTASMPHWSRHM